MRATAGRGLSGVWGPDRLWAVRVSVAGRVPVRCPAAQRWAGRPAMARASGSGLISLVQWAQRLAMAGISV